MSGGISSHGIGAFEDDVSNLFSITPPVLLRSGLPELLRLGHMSAAFCLPLRNT